MFRLISFFNLCTSDKTEIYDEKLSNLIDFEYLNWINFIFDSNRDLYGEFDFDYDDQLKTQIKVQGKKRTIDKRHFLKLIKKFMKMKKLNWFITTNTIDGISYRLTISVIISHTNDINETISNLQQN
jgi:hypothetical protein